METKYFGVLAESENKELLIEKIRITVSAAELMTKHVDGKRLTVLCRLLSMKNTLADETPSYISLASRALAAKLLVRRTAATDVCPLHVNVTWSHC